MCTIKYFFKIRKIVIDYKSDVWYYTNIGQMIVHNKRLLCNPNTQFNNHN